METNKQRYIKKQSNLFETPADLAAYFDYANEIAISAVAATD